MRKQFLVLEAVQDRLDRVRSTGPAKQLGQLGAQVGQRPRAVEDQAVEQLVDHARVVDQDLRQELAVADVHVQLQPRRVEAEQLPQDRLAAERRGHLFQVDQRQVGSGVAATARSSCGAMLARKCRQRRVDRNRCSCASRVRFCQAAGTSRKP